MTNPKPLSLKLSWSTCNKCCGKMMDRGISELCHTAILKPSGKLSWTSTAALLSWLCKVLGSTHSPAKQTPQKTTVAVPEVCLAKTTLSALFTTPWPSVWENKAQKIHLWMPLLLLPLTILTGPTHTEGHFQSKSGFQIQTSWNWNRPC